jgi:hypothetical protein
VSQPSTVKSFPDARGPHLPDTLTRLSPWVLVFAAIVLLQLWRLADGWGPSVIAGDARSAIEYVLSWIPAMTAPLIGVALFYRHRDARQNLRLLVFGVILLSVGELLSAFQEPIRAFLRGLTPADDPTLLAETPGEFAFRVFTLLLTIFGLVYVGAGLAAARLHEATKAERPLTVWLAALSVVGTIVSLTALTALPPDATPTLIVQVVIGVVLSAVVTFAWAYLAVVTISGWIAREAPRRAWRIAALATSILFGFRLIFPALSLVPFGPDSRPILSLLAYISWTAWALLIVAFALGLPATAANATGGPPEATSPDSAGG